MYRLNGAGKQCQLQRSQPAATLSEKTEKVAMALPPEEYESAWKRDKSIRTEAEAILKEWQENVEQAETAWELTDLIDSQLDPNKALSVIFGIMALDIGEQEIAHLGAGPLEDFLNSSGPGYIDVIEQLAERNPRFKRVLAHVWQTDEMDPTVWQRVKGAVGRHLC
jgi:hypothetical protein